MPIIQADVELNKDLSLDTSNGQSLRRVGQGHPHSLPGQARSPLDNAFLQDYLRKVLLT
jgi:hypothetical protein